MKWAVVHLVRGEAGQYLESLRANLFKKFDTFPLHRYVPPHITLKYPFEVNEDIAGVLYKKLETFAGLQRQIKYSLVCFGSFKEYAIYVGVTYPKEMLQSILDLMKTLHGVDGITFDEFDGSSNLHATIATSKYKALNYGLVWGYLKTLPEPNFKLKFDNIAILKKNPDRWVIDHVWEINER